MSSCKVVRLLQSLPASKLPGHVLVLLNLVMRGRVRPHQRYTQTTQPTSYMNQPNPVSDLGVDISSVLCS